MTELEIKQLVENILFISKQSSVQFDSENKIISLLDYRNIFTISEKDNLENFIFYEKMDSLQDVCSIIYQVIQAINPDKIDLSVLKEYIFNRYQHIDKGRIYLHFKGK